MGTKKIVLRIVLAMAFGCLAAEIGLSMHYMYSRPRSPDPKAGLVYPNNIHGAVVYLTRQEDEMLSALFWGTIVCIAIAFAVAPAKPKDGA